MFQDLVTVGTLEKRESFENFQKFASPLDSFYVSLKLEPELMLVIKLIVSLFHGNANVERGFKVNKDSLADNMSERSVCSLRFVHDSLTSQMKDKKISSIPISDNLVTSVKQARK